MDLSSAADLKEAVLENVDSGTMIRIDSAQVEQMTTPCIQMILAISAYIDSKKNAKMTIANPTDAFIDGFNDLGLFSQLMSWNIE